MTVTITRNDQGRIREAGRFLWDGVRIIVDPTEETDRPLLMQMLADPILVDRNGVAEMVSTATPEKFLRNLCREYKGSYLRASRPE